MSFIDTGFDSWTTFSPSGAGFLPPLRTKKMILQKNKCYKKMIDTSFISAF